MSTVSEVKSLLLKTFTKDVRTQLNSQPHFVPLSTKLLEVFLQDRLVGIPVSKFISELLVETRSIISTKVYHIGQHLYLDPAGRNIVGLHNIPTNSLVYSGSHLQGALFRNYSSTSSLFFTPILNKKFAKYLKEYDVGFRSHKKQFDIAHTEIETNIEGKYLARVPGLMQAENVTNTITSPGVGRSMLLADNPEEASRLLQELLEQIQVTREEFTLHSAYGGLVGATLSKDFKAALLSVEVNIILINTSEENQYEFNRLYESPFAGAITKLIKKLHFSNSMEEEIKERVVNTILGKKSKDSKASAKIVGNARIKLSKVPISKSTEKAPPLRTTRGQFYSLTSLQVLINASLQHVISANMGDQPYPGGQRKILNYRTGRFASSAQVERLSQSRAGMITAFYSYMKYPYQTFEPGFAQGSPESRDPKLLISKSIREIAATKVGNRMRAVLV